MQLLFVNLVVRKMVLGVDLRQMVAFRGADGVDEVVLEFLIFRSTTWWDARWRARAPTGCSRPSSAARR